MTRLSFTSAAPGDHWAENAKGSAAKRKYPRQGAPTLTTPATRDRGRTGHAAAPLGNVPPAERALLGLLVTGFVVAATALAAGPTVLGHDESVYALWARAWLSGGTDVGVGVHRAPLLPALGVLVLAVDSREVAFRLVGVAFGVGGLVGAWALTRSLASTVAGPAVAGGAGLLAAVTFSFAPAVFDAAGLFLTDLPAATMLVWAALVCWHQLEVRDRPGVGLAAAALLAAAAFHLRYGAALPIAVLGITVAVLWGPALVRHRRVLAITVAVFAVLVLPHAVNATLEFGVPWGRIAATADAGAADRLGQGLREYAALLPLGLGGPVAEAVWLLAGVGGTVRLALAAGRREWSPAVRAWLLLLVPGVAQFVASGLTAPGEPRFVFFAFAFLTVAGWLLLAEAAARAASPAVAAVVGVAVVAVALAGGAREISQRHAAAGNHPVLRAAAAEVRERGYPSCSVLSAYGPRLTWYSGCPTHNFGYPPRAGREDALEGDHRFLLVLGGHVNQPEGALLEEYLELVDEPLAEWDLGDRDEDWGALYELDA